MDHTLFDLERKLSKGRKCVDDDSSREKLHTPMLAYAASASSSVLIPCLLAAV